MPYTSGLNKDNKNDWHSQATDSCKIRSDMPVTDRSINIWNLQNQGKVVYQTTPWAIIASAIFTNPAILAPLL
jgi:hypothetical protein